MSGGLLGGVRVLDLSIWRPGPYATQLLAEAGADVIKIEPPGGDPMRVYPGLFAGLHANKRSVMLDLKDTGDRARALELAAEADVVVEGFRPGVVERLGVGYEVVVESNPSVVYCSVAGFGQDGPLAGVAGHDLNYLAWAGALAPEGGAPSEPAIPVADLAGGMAAAFAICAALVRRAGTGEGERIDIALADVVATWTGAATPDVAELTASPRASAGYGVFATADGGHVTLGVISEDHFWAALCDCLGLTGDRDLGFGERLARVDELQARLAAAVATRPLDALVAELLAAGVPTAPVLDRAEMLAHPHFRARGVATADPWADAAVGYPARFTLHPAGRTAPPPELDEHRGASFHPRA